jgi:hypothetical protein
MKRYQNLLFGCDPELFLVNPNNGEYRSAHQYVPGTKEKPHLVDKGAIQLDGVAAEFNIMPVSNPNDWVRNINTVWSQLNDVVRPSGYALRADPVATFDRAYFSDNIPAENKVLGCNPDFNAWELCPNDPPQATESFRTGSGHIHIGWGKNFDTQDPLYFEECAEVARQLDYYLGIWSLLWDRDHRRRALYGCAGAFRPKPYGLEYRVLSNAWLRSEPLMRWVFHAAKSALEDLDEGLRYEDFHKDLARHIINDNHTEWFREPGAPVIDKVPPPPGMKATAYR